MGKGTYLSSVLKIFISLYTLMRKSCIKMQRRNEDQFSPRGERFQGNCLYFTSVFIHIYTNIEIASDVCK